MHKPERRNSSVGRCAGAALVMVAAIVLAVPTAQGADYDVLTKFTTGDGTNPEGNLILKNRGLYGTTSTGGASSSCGGTVFRLDVKTGQLKVLYRFLGPTAYLDGCQPEAGLIADSAGNLYGTTYYGGDSAVACSGGCGTVFKVNIKSGKETVLHNFIGSDGAYPIGGLVSDSIGNLYGTTVDFGGGTVFRLDASGNLTTLHRFGGAGDGSGPVGSLAWEGGLLYGTTFGGGLPGCDGYGCGTVFQVDPASGQETVLYNFTGKADGGDPSFYGSLSGDGLGNLYGTVSQGGMASASEGFGVVYRVNIPTGQQTVLHTFTGGLDGGKPAGGVIRDSQGNLYGTTTAGGPGGSAGHGTIFKLDMSGNLTTFHGFRAKPGAGPLGGLVESVQGSFYGTTAGFGVNSGIVYRIKP
jgi:uncharacterized repeat protein (TIGR03803 family)